ncbi:hypothetical protein PtrV1_04867 [Pyrenophora tritici-repentis]|nr:hypothetical protein PtrV1_04867 [Pyrenophora tritici-repentis]KAF7452567.1 hypothetical protein A1F99_043450 [Pyrenophora tritici-repentis]
MGTSTGKVVSKLATRDATERTGNERFSGMKFEMGWALAGSFGNGRCGIM